MHLSERGGKQIREEKQCLCLSKKEVKRRKESKHDQNTRRRTLSPKGRSCFYFLQATLPVQMIPYFLCPGGGSYYLDPGF